MDGELIDEIDVEIRDYLPNPGQLVAGRSSVEETLVSNLLKTNCPLTGQPDWASIQIRYKGPRIEHAGLLKYLVSFRQHGGFHEHCVESIFMDVLKQCRPDRLTVYARYTRRGGLDINPFRTNCGDKLPRNVRTARQ
jgi:7-cyano-7-deazaguanine reductase